MSNFADGQVKQIPAVVPGPPFRAGTSAHRLKRPRDGALAYQPRPPQGPSRINVVVLLAEVVFLGTDLRRYFLSFPKAANRHVTPITKSRFERFSNNNVTDARSALATKNEPQAPCAWGLSLLPQ